MTTVHPSPGDNPDSSGQLDVSPTEVPPTIEPAPTSVLDLVNRTLADPRRTTNATKIVTSVSTGAARVIVRIGFVLVVGIAVVGLLIHFVGVGSAVGGAITMGGLGAVAGGRYIWNRRAAKQKSATRRRA